MQITGGKFNSRKIKVPEYDNIKPTLSKTRQGIFNTLCAMMDFDKKIFIDMFSGSGIVALEAVSRGFSVIMFEKDKKTAIAIKENFMSFNLTPEIYFGDVLKNLPKINKKADVIFIDPPYDSDLYEKSLKLIKDSQALNDNGIVILEHPIDKKIDIKGFDIIKAKTYGNKQISYISLSE